MKPKVPKEVWVFVKELPKYGSCSASDSKAWCDKQRGCAEFKPPVRYVLPRADSIPATKTEERLKEEVVRIAMDGCCYSHSPVKTWPMSLLRRHEKSPLFFGALARLELHRRKEKSK